MSGPVADAPNKDGDKIGLIVGLTVAGIAALAVLTVTLVWLSRKRVIELSSKKGHLVRTLRHTCT